MPRETIVEGRWIITGGGDAPTFHDAALLISDGRVAEIADRRSLRASHPDADAIGGPRFAVMPGLINAHHHSHAVTTLQQGVPDMLLESWLIALAACRNVPARLATLMSVYRLLRSGVTSVVDVISGGATEHAFAATVRETLSAYDTAGMRAAVAAGVSFECLLVAGDDQEFIASLPNDVQTIARARLAFRRGISPGAYLDVMSDLAATWASHPRVALWYGPPGPQWVGDKALVDIVAEAERYDAGVQTHALESFYEGLYGRLAYGEPTIVHLERLGVLSERFSIAHGVWLTEAEVEILARTGAAVSHNPSSNLRLRAGIAPLNALCRAGATVALGMDGTAINDDEDMFAEMRLALRLHRPPEYGDEPLAPADILEIATGGGATLMRRAHDLGRLEIGACADLVLIDLERVLWPWTAPDIDARDLVVQRARSDDVALVMVAGEIVYRDGRPTRFDLDAVAAEVAAALRSQEGRPAGAADAERLRPHVEAYYRGWDVPGPAPYVSYNSRT